MTLLPKMTITTVDTGGGFANSDQEIVTFNIDENTKKVDVEIDGKLYQSVPCRYESDVRVFTIGEWDIDNDRPIFDNYPFSIAFMAS